MEKNLTKLEKMLELLEQDQVSFDDLEKVLNAFTEIVNQLKFQINREVGGAMAKYEKITRLFDTLEAKINKSVKEFDTFPERIEALKSTIEQAKVESHGKIEERCQQIEVSLAEESKKMVEVCEDMKPEKIKEKLLSIGLEYKDIKGLGEILERMGTSLGHLGMRRVPIVKRYNLSSQCDGVTKSFTLPNDTVDVLGIFGTQFPINFNPGTDWTFTGRTLTLTGEVSAPETGQTLYAIIETLFYG